MPRKKSNAAIPISPTGFENMPYVTIGMDSRGWELTEAEITSDLPYTIITQDDIPHQALWIEDHIAPGNTAVYDNDPITLKFTDKAFNAEGDRFDVVLTLKEIEIHAIDVDLMAEKILHNYYEAPSTIAMSTATGQCSRLLVEVSVVDKEGNPIEGTVTASFYDLDPGSPGDPGCEPSAESHIICQYQEAVKIVTPPDSAVYIAAEGSVVYADSEGDRFSGSRGLSPEEEAEGLSTISYVTTLPYAIEWTGGNGVGTGLFSQLSDFIRYILNAKIVGAYPDGGRIVISEGTIDADGNTEVPLNSTREYFFEPAGGYTVKDVVVDGESIGAANRYIFADIKDDHTITVEFEPKINHGLESRPLRRTIHYRYAHGGVAAPDEIQTVSFTRPFTQNMVTGEVTYGEWEPDTDCFEKVKSPSISGYRTATPVVGIQCVSPDDDWIEVTVLYVMAEGCEMDEMYICGKSALFLPKTKKGCCCGKD